MKILVTQETYYRQFDFVKLHEDPTQLKSIMDQMELKPLPKRRGSRKTWQISSSGPARRLQDDALDSLDEESDSEDASDESSSDSQAGEGRFGHIHKHGEDGAKNRNILPRSQPFTPSE